MHRQEDLTRKEILEVWDTGAKGEKKNQNEAELNAELPHERGVYLEEFKTDVHTKTCSCMSDSTSHNRQKVEITQLSTIG